MTNIEILETTNNIDIKSVQPLLPLYYFRDQETTGSTRTKGQIELTDLDSRIHLYAWFDVRKSGMSGVGKGALAFEMLNSNFEPIVKLSHGLTV